MPRASSTSRARAPPGDRPGAPGVRVGGGGRRQDGQPELQHTVAQPGARRPRAAARGEGGDRLCRHVVCWQLRNVGFDRHVWDMSNVQGVGIGAAAHVNGTAATPRRSPGMAGPARIAAALPPTAMHALNRAGRRASDRSAAARQRRVLRRGAVAAARWVPTALRCGGCWGLHLPASCAWCRGWRALRPRGHAWHPLFLTLGACEPTRAKHIHPVSCRMSPSCHCCHHAQGPSCMTNTYAPASRFAAAAAVQPCG